MRRRQQSAVYACVRRPAEALAATLALPASTIAHAQTASRLDLFGDLQNSHEVFIGASFVGLTLFSVTLALLHIAERRRAHHRESALIGDLNETRAALDRAETFLAAESQITIVWGPSEPEIVGDASLVGDMAAPERVLVFGAWLASDQVHGLEAAVTRLRERGEPFRLAVVALNGRTLEVEGRAVTGRAVVRVRDVSGDRLEVTRLREAAARANGELETGRALLDAVPAPAWSRDDQGRLTWVNTSYAKAVEMPASDVLSRGVELLESTTRDAAAARRGTGELFRTQTAAVLEGWRRALDVFEVTGNACSAGVAFDVSDLERARVDLQNLIEAHARLLDQLSTAVAIFDHRKQLVFYNAAYRILWSLDAGFLDQKPSESEVLDRLRARRLLPEQADFRGWKATHLAGYQSTEPVAPQTWHLPDGRALRVVTNPNPNGITYLFDDLSTEYQLVSRFNAQTRVQRETLDTLKEGVAVFGTDGRLKLFNAAFPRLWHLEPDDLADQPHVDRVADLCAELAPATEPWSQLRTAVAGLHDQRIGLDLRLACRDGAIIDCTAAPLPDGATLLTFTDVTASVNVERALTDRHQALLETEKLRNDFVHYFSYELRSPLTNIIGFSQLLGDGSIGSLNPKQSEYVGYVMKSSAALLAIINDILDLATIDTGALELNLQEIDVVETIKAAAEGLQDRLAESSLGLQIVALPNIGAFRADPKRVRQVLFNLLSNAIGFSAPGQTVTLAALRRGNEIVFKVSDRGRGIPDDLLKHVFDRFRSSTVGGRQRGVGLGLPIVKSFVELHGGRVFIDSAPGEGTTVTCIFPAQDDSVAAAAPSDPRVAKD